MKDMHNSQRGFFAIPPKNTFFNPDDGDGGTQTPAATDGDNATANSSDGTEGDDAGSNSTDEEKVYTKAEFEQMFGPRAKRAGETAVKSLLSELKFETQEEMTEFLTNARKKADDELTELERLQKQLGDLEPEAAQVAELKQKLADYEEQTSERVRILVKEMNIPKHFVALLEGKTPSDQLKYINENRDEFKATPTPPNTNAGEKGSNKQSAQKTVRAKYGIPKRHNRR